MIFSLPLSGWVLAGLLAAEPESPPPAALEHVLKAQMASLMGDRSRESQEWLLSLSLDPSPYILGRLRLSLRSGEGLEALVPGLEEALRVHPGSTGLMRLLAEIQSRLGNETRALELYRLILSLEPGEGAASTAAADIQRRQGDLAGAGEDLEKALALRPQDAGLIYHLAQVELEAGRKGKAERLFRKALGRDPGQALSVLALGVLYRGSGRGAKAEKLYGDFLLLHPHSIPVRRERAEFAEAQARWEDAETDFEILAASGFGRPGDYLGLGLARLHQDLPEAALESLDAGLNASPGHPALLFYKAQTLGALGRAPEGLTLLRGLREGAGSPPAFPSLSDLSQQEGLLYYKLHDDAGALEAFRRAAQEAPRDGEAAYAWGVSAQLAGKAEEAEQAFLRCLDLAPHHVEAFYQLGLIRSQSGRAAEAEAAWRQVLGLDPEHSEAQNALGYSLAERGESLPEAESLIRAALRADPENGAYLDSLAWVHFRQGKPREAERELRLAASKLAEKGEPDAVVLEHWGDALGALGRMDEAREAWTKALSLRPDNPGLKEKARTGAGAAP